MLIGIFWNRASDFSNLIISISNCVEIKITDVTSFVEESFSLQPMAIDIVYDFHMYLLDCRVKHIIHIWMLSVKVMNLGAGDLANLYSFNI